MGESYTERVKVDEGKSFSFTFPGCKAGKEKNTLKKLSRENSPRVFKKQQRASRRHWIRRARPENRYTLEHLNNFHFPSLLPLSRKTKSILKNIIIRRRKLSLCFRKTFRDNFSALPQSRYFFLASEKFYHPPSIRILNGCYE